MPLRKHPFFALNNDAMARPTSRFTHERDVKKLPHKKLNRALASACRLRNLGTHSIAVDAVEHLDRGPQS